MIAARFSAAAARSASRAAIAFGSPFNMASACRISAESSTSARFSNWAELTERARFCQMEEQLENP
jgi:hypothetical protein